MPTTITSAGFVNICVKAAEEALETPANKYSAYQRNSLAAMHKAMIKHGGMMRRPPTPS